MSTSVEARKTLEQDFEIGTEEAGVPALGDAVLTCPGEQRRPELGAGIAFDAVGAFVAVELAPEIDAVGSMRFLEEDDRDVRQRGQPPRCAPPG